MPLNDLRGWAEEFDAISKDAVSRASASEFVAWLALNETAGAR